MRARNKPAKRQTKPREIAAVASLDSPPNRSPAEPPAKRASGRPAKTAAEAPVPSDIKQKFQTAVDRLVERARSDIYILALVVAGSMSHDTVWEKSDLDLIVVTRDDKAPTYRLGKGKSWALIENGVNVHAMGVSRADFKKIVDGQLQTSFMHSLIAKSTLVFTRDATIREWFDGIGRVGAHDRELQMFSFGTLAIPGLYKAQKWYHAKQDYVNASWWVWLVVAQLAKVEVVLEGQIVGREAIQQALAINPDFFTAVYSDFAHAPKTPETVGKVLEMLDAYIMRKARMLFAPLLEYLEAAGEPRSASDIDQHFAREHGIENATWACEYLADKGILLQVGTPIRLTEKSSVEFEEMAFAYERGAKW